LKLVKQVQLFCQEGTSDKVYEIDLCESGDGYVVNFRYGRRGSALKEGTKTIFPVSLQEAEKAFNSLEQEKRKKGYATLGETAIDLTAAPKPRAAASTDKRKKVIAKILKAAALGEDEPENWPLSRIIWRAGDLKLTETIPHMIELADPSDQFNIYSVVRSIGRCGSSKQLPFLNELLQIKLAESTQLLIKEAIIELSDEKDKKVLLQNITETLPAPFKQSIIADNYKELERQLREFLFELKTASNEYLIALYQITRQDSITHYFFRKILADIPLDVNYFKYIRHIFKVAEMLGDYATYSVIAKNIEKQGSTYHVSYWDKPEQKKKKAFSDKTKLYLTKRVVRTLNNFGEAGESSYTAMACEILLAYDDKVDLSQPYSTSYSTYNYNSDTRRYTTVNHTNHFDSYSKFNAFNFILYKNSPRYEAGKTEWRCKASYKPGGTVPDAREEAYSKLWNQAPAETIKLLAHSKCRRVHEFAHKVFKANADFEAQVEINHVICFIQSPFDITQKLGLELARKAFNKQAPDKELLSAMLDCSLEEARKQAEQWIQELKAILFTDSEFICSLLLLRTVEAHAWLRGLLTITKFKKEQGDIITVKVIAYLISLNIQSEEDEVYATQIGDSLLICFAETLKSVDLSIIQDLFRHASPVIHAIAGKILIKHEIKPESLPEDFLKLLLQSEYVQSRNIGIELLGQFPENLLLQKKEILVSFCLSPMPDVRNAVKPLISKLVKAYPAFGEELVNLFMPAFLMKESYEGVHADLLNLLSTELSESLHVISHEQTFTLLNAKFRIAQLLGAVLLKKNIREEALTITELVKIISNPLEDVRIFTRSIFVKYPEKIKAQKEEAIRITDSIWDDTRAFAFDYFRNTFLAGDWNAELLVSLCDSTKEDVQDFGREMIIKCSLQEDGTEYLLKLSQHPNTNLQLFTSAYLEKYAGGNPEIIEKLKLYFITLLSQVNKGKVAKARAMDFLRKEAMKDEHIAGIAAEIFTRISASVAVTEKAGCIEALRDIRRKHPTLASSIIVKEYSDYSKV
jgi:predicted DNA-binding WGR domain protein